MKTVPVQGDAKQFEALMDLENFLLGTTSGTDQIHANAAELDENSRILKISLEAVRGIKGNNLVIPVKTVDNHNDDLIVHIDFEQHLLKVTSKLKFTFTINSTNTAVSLNRRIVPWKFVETRSYDFSLPSEEKFVNDLTADIVKIMKEPLFLKEFNKGLKQIAKSRRRAGLRGLDFRGKMTAPSVKKVLSDMYYKHSSL